MRPASDITAARRDKQGLTARQDALADFGVDRERIYTDHGETGRTRARRGLSQALAAVRAGDTLVVTKLDRLARSVPEAREIPDQLVGRGVKLALGGATYDRWTRWARCSSTFSPSLPNSSAT